MTTKRLLILIVLSIGFSNFGYSQNKTNDKEKIKALNNYVNFTNESIHGILIIQRLLENFNKSVNKYVDLPDQKVNFYSNNDLPKDIFEDPENLFYFQGTSPNEWYANINGNNTSFGTSIDNGLKTNASTIKSISAMLNQIRFDLENQINTLDLKKRENLSLVYDKMEEAVKLYKDFYKAQLELEKSINLADRSLTITQNSSFNTKLNISFQSIYKANRAALNALYHKDDDVLPNLIKDEKDALNTLNAIPEVELADYIELSSKFKIYWENMKNQLNSAIAVQSSFVDGEDVPEEHKIYDRFYYFYNYATLNKFNRYSNGIVFDMNQINDQIGIQAVRYVEMPHYFKVIYPKIMEKNDFLAASDPVVKSIPTIVKGRAVITANRQIRVDSDVVEFNMYDHKIIDKDIVSISFNGDWIVEKFTISEKPFPFTLKLNDEGKNYLLLHAEDVGRNPPATIALSYKYKGKTEIIILNSDIKTSEVIEITSDQKAALKSKK